MKAGKVLLVLAVLLFLVVVGTYAQDKYVPKANEELYGTWINKNLPKKQAEKNIISSGVWQDYDLVSDSTPNWAGTEQIDSKWTDSEGNIWYKTLGTITVGTFKGSKIQRLYEVSKSGTMRESEDTAVATFDPNSYPTGIDPKDRDYEVYYRAERMESAPAASAQEQDWTLGGTWINKAYETSRVLEAKMVFEADGTILVYQTLISTSSLRGKYSIESDWTESGIHWLKVKEDWGSPYIYFDLIKLTNNGNTFEGVSTQEDYPATFDPKSHFYEIYYREVN